MKLRRHVQPIATKRSFAGSIVKQAVYDFKKFQGNDGLTVKAVG
jgi:hypothetical protein